MGRLSVSFWILFGLLNAFVFHIELASASSLLDLTVQLPLAEAHSVQVTYTTDSSSGLGLFQAYGVTEVIATDSFSAQIPGGGVFDLTARINMNTGRALSGSLNVTFNHPAGPILFHSVDLRSFGYGPDDLFQAIFAPGVAMPASPIAGASQAIGVVIDGRSISTFSDPVFTSDFANNGAGAAQTYTFYSNRLPPPLAIAQVPVTRSPNPAVVNIAPSASNLVVYQPGNGFVHGGTVDTSLPTVVLTHGYSSSAAQWNDFAQHYPGAGTTVNVVAWDWNASSLLNTAASRTPDEGAGLGTTLVSLLGNGYDKPIHFFGHSLGTLVNARAVDVFNTHTNDSSRTQVTLFDEAEVVNEFTNSQWALATPPSDKYAFLDNYISAFGSLHGGANNANIILDWAQSGPIGFLNLASFHAYPQAWYDTTLKEGMAAPTVGYGWATENQNPTKGAFPSGQYLAQALFPRDPLSLQPISAASAKSKLDLRDIGQSPAETVTGAIFFGESVIDSAVEAVGQVRNSLVGPSFGLQLTLGGSAGPVTAQRLAAALNLALPDAESAPTPSYAWMWVSIPTDATTLSFDFTYAGLDPSDYLAVGINDTQLFALEAAYVPDSTLQNSGLLDVSQWAGQRVEFFFGNTGIAPAGMVTLDNMQFLVVPEPVAFGTAAITFALFLLRRQRFTLRAAA
jgi:pimeloyl-ACP methyl ester carboxylesterase